jgi:exonuclease III
MKEICWNVWGGKRTNEVLNFIEEQNLCDIFCFQEVFDNGICTRPVFDGANMQIFGDIQKTLNNHNGFFVTHQDNEEGLGIFVNKGIRVIDIGDVFVHKQRNAMVHNNGAELGRNLQYIETEINSKRYFFINFHGLWDKSGKSDTPERILQSQNIIEFLEKYKNIGIILSGDFNLASDTESIKILERYGLINLNSRFGITSTRSDIYNGPVRCVDYVFVNYKIKVIDFKTIKSEASDHLPLLLEFE